MMKVVKLRSLDDLFGYAPTSKQLQFYKGALKCIAYYGGARGQGNALISGFLKGTYDAELQSKVDHR